MSYSIFLLRFDCGHPVPLDNAVFQELTAPYVVRRDPAHEFLSLRMPDGGTAEVYGGAASDGTLASVMLTHFDTGDVLELVAELAASLHAAVVLQDGVAVVADAGQREHLVADLRPDAVIVDLSGAAIQAAIERC